MCQSEVSDYQAYFGENGLPEGVDIYSISTSAERSRDNYPPSEWLEREGWSIPVVVDDNGDSVGTAFGLNAFPFNVFVDANGVVIGRIAGGIGVNDMISIIDQLG